MLRETKPCKCGKKMILISSGTILFTYPAQHPQEWFCDGCGHKEKGPTLRGMTKDEIDRDAWEQTNQE